jgi:TetR/AcrR family transcriptional regulator, regulator of cefoperazone and chloramphenicol sensitivity
MRSKVEMGYARGEETRARILGVAIDLFGTKGFDSVSTREIAAAAAVPPASLRYYFANKKGLYVACLEHLQAVTFHLMESALIEAECLLADESTEVDDLIESFCSLQDALIDSMLGGPDKGTAALFMIRHDLPSEGGSGALVGEGTAARRMLGCFTRMVVRISGDRLDPQTALIVAGLLNGQLTNIYVRRNRLFEIGWEITPERVQLIKQMIRQHSSAVLRSYSGEGAVGPKTTPRPRNSIGE